MENFKKDVANWLVLHFFNSERVADWTITKHEDFVKEEFELGTPADVCALAMIANGF